MKNKRYNKYENLEIMSFYDVEDVNEIIDKKLSHLDDDEDLAVYCKRDVIGAVFLNMISEGYDFGYINFDKLDDLLKDKVYLLTVTKDYRVNIEPAYNNAGKIIDHESEIVLIYTEDCKQDIVDYFIDNNDKVILFDFEDDDGYCGNEKADILTKCSKSKNLCTSDSAGIYKSEEGNPVVFSINRYRDKNEIASKSSYSFFAITQIY